MERDISHRTAGGRTLHSYTPRSHEDLLRSHIHLDNDKQTRLNNDIKRYKGENESLRRDFDRIQRDLKSKDEEIRALQDELRNKPEHDHPDSPAFVFEVDGKAATLDELIDHFNGVIQRHHDLIDKKTQEINDLEALLGPRQHHRPRRDEGTQSVRQRSSREIKEHLMNDFAQHLAQVRKEYEIVQNILTDRNNQCENIIHRLQNKLNQYEKEIQLLRSDLSKLKQKKEQDESLMYLVSEKERENEILKDILSSLQRQGPPEQRNVILNQEPGSKNQNLEHEIIQIIESKRNIINKLNKIISDIQKEPSNIKKEENSDFSEVERGRQRMIEELNNMNKKLNQMLTNFKTPSNTVIENETVNTSYIISNLEKLKQQCQDEIDALTNQIQSRDLVVMKGQAIVTIDNPDTFKKIMPPPSYGNEDNKSLGTIKTPSYVKYRYHPQEVESIPELSQRYNTPSENSKGPVSYTHRPLIGTQASVQTRENSLFSTPMSYINSSHPSTQTYVRPRENSLISSPKDYTNRPHVSTQTPVKPREHSPFSNTHGPHPSFTILDSYISTPKPQSQISCSVTDSKMISHKDYPIVPCEACSEPVIPKPETPPQIVFQPPPPKPKPKSRGCCGKGTGARDSTTSTVPYGRDDSPPKSKKIKSKEKKQKSSNEVEVNAHNLPK